MNTTTKAVVIAAGAGLVIAFSKTATLLVATGSCLAVGFWIGKKITNKFDELLILADEDYINSFKGV